MGTSEIDAQDTRSDRTKTYGNTILEQENVGMSRHGRTRRTTRGKETWTAESECLNNRRTGANPYGDVN